MKKRTLPSDNLRRLASVDHGPRWKPLADAAAPVTSFLEHTLPGVARKMLCPDGEDDGNAVSALRKVAELILGAVYDGGNPHAPVMGQLPGDSTRPWPHFRHGPHPRTMTFHAAGSEDDTTAFTLTLVIPDFLLRDTVTVRTLHEESDVTVVFIQAKGGRRLRGRNGAERLLEKILDELPEVATRDSFRSLQSQLLDFIEDFLILNETIPFVSTDVASTWQTLSVDLKPRLDAVAREHGLATGMLQNAAREVMRLLLPLLEDMEKARLTILTGGPKWRLDVLAASPSLPPEARQAAAETDALWESWRTRGFIGSIPAPGDRAELLETRLLPVDTRLLSRDEARRMAGLLNPDDMTGILVNSPASEGIPFLRERIDSVQMIYTDPPWRTGRDFTYRDALPLRQWQWMILDTMDSAARMLTEDGSVLVHISPEGARFARPLMERLLEPAGEMVWAYRTGGAPSKHSPLARKHDVILHYTAGSRPFFRRLKERVYYEKPFFTSERDDSGRPYADVVLRDVFEGSVTVVRDSELAEFNLKPVINVSRERVPGFHTQKPEGLLALLMEIFSRPGDWIADPFGGTGTTAISALKSGRRFALCEMSRAHTAIIAGRLLGAMIMQGCEPCGVTELYGFSGGGAVLMASPII